MSVGEMLAAVWKYELKPGFIDIDMPVGAVPLRVGVQGATVVLWALVIAERDTRDGMRPVPTKPRRFLSVGTGHRYHPSVFGKYIGSVEYPGGLVFHVFESGIPR